MKRGKILSVMFCVFINIGIYSQNSLTISGTGMTIQPGITLSNVGNININDNNAYKGFLNNAGTVYIEGSLNNTSSTGLLGTGEMIFSGSNQQNVSGINTFGLLTFNKIKGTVTAMGNMAVNGQVKFIKGVLNTTDNAILTLNQNATVYGSTQELSGASDSSYVNGPMIKNGNSNFIFPIGKSSATYPLHSIGVEFNDTTSSTFIAEYFNQAPVNTSSNSGEIQSISNSEYWSLQRNAGSENVYLSLSLRNIPISDPENMVVLYYNQTNNTWDNMGNTGILSLGQNTMNIRSLLVSNFNLFTYGTLTSQQTVSGMPQYFNPMGNNGNSISTQYHLTIYPNPNSGQDINVNVNKNVELKGQ